MDGKNLGNKQGVTNMFRKLSGILLALVMLVVFSLNVYSAPPGEEDWALGSFNHGGLTTAGYTINTTNLQVSQFWINSQSDVGAYLYIKEDGIIIFDLHVEAYSGLTTKPISNFKFHRLPATDPDDPNSIRYPNGVAIFFRSD